MAYPAYVGKVFDADRVRVTAGLVNVQWYRADGNGGPGAAAANEIAIAAAQAAADLTGRGLYFPLGAYYKTTGLYTNRAKMAFVGDVGTEIHFPVTVTNMMFLDGGNGPIAGAAMYEIIVENLALIGPTLVGCATGLLLRNVNQSTIRNIRVENVTDDALKLETSTGNVIDSFAHTVNRVFFAPTAARGVHLTRRAVDAATTFTSTMNVFLNVTVEGLQTGVGIGILLDHASSNCFLAGTSEGNNRGIQLTANALFNYFVRNEMVQNVVYDIECAGVGNVFEDCLSQAAVTFTAAAGCRANILRDGFYGGTITNSSALPQRYDSFVLAAAGAIVDAVTPAKARLYYSNLTSAWVSDGPGSGQAFTYTCTGAELADFFIPLPVNQPNDNYTAQVTCGGVAVLFLIDAPDLIATDRKVNEFRVQTSINVAAGDRLDVVITSRT